MKNPTKTNPMEKDIELKQLIKGMKSELKTLKRAGKIKEWYLLSAKLKSIKIPKRLGIKKPKFTGSNKIIYKKALDKAKRYVKRRDKWICQKCKRFVGTSGVNSQSSHVIPESADHRLSVDHQNLKLLCYHCHLNWWHKNPLEAGEWFKVTFPERYEYLQAKKIENQKLGTIPREHFEERHDFYTKEWF